MNNLQKLRPDMKKNIILMGCVMLITHTAKSQIPYPAKRQDAPILIKGATIHVGNGSVIENGMIGFENGKITEVGERSTDESRYSLKIDATGKHIYPGFILPNTILGLVEIDAVKATRDFEEVGAINPSVRTLIGYNAESKIIPTVRSNGVLICQSVPRGGLVSGTSSIFNLDGWNWEDAVLKADDGVWFNWPVERYNTGWWVEPGEDKLNEKRKSQLEQLQSLLERARVYNHETVDLNLASLKGLFDGSQRAYVTVNRAKEIKEAVLFFKKMGVQKIVVCGGAESHLVADFLKQESVPVLLERLHALPFKSDDPYDLPYAGAYLLQQAGVLYGLSYSGGMEAMGSRNLPFLAGTAITMGLTYEEAVQSITLNTAKILGIDNRCGSLEPGKDATLFISSGDAFDMISNQPEMAFIQGRSIDLGSHQLDLYRRYMQKYGLK
jgi:imidazolonepropionase-like amidohydrolase